MTDLLMAILFIPMLIAAVGITNMALLFIIGLTKRNRQSRKRMNTVLFRSSALRSNSNALQHKAG